MTGDVYEPETDTESESGEVEVVSIGWSRTHPSSATYTIPSGGFVTAQVTEHASWIENERHWEETYQVKYYFSTSPPPQSSRALRPYVSSPPIPIPGASSPQPGAEGGAIPKFPRAKPNLLQRMALRNRLSPQENVTPTVERALAGSFLTSGFHSEMSPEEVMEDDDQLLRPIRPESPTVSVGISPTLRPIPVVHPLQHLRQLSSDTARALWEDALSASLPFETNTVEMPTAGPFYLEDISLPSDNQPPRGCKRPRSFTTSCLEEELSRALDVAQLDLIETHHLDSFPVNNPDPMATMAFPPEDVHMLTMSEGASQISNLANLLPLPSSGSSPPSLLLPTPPSLPQPPTPAVRYRPMRKMCNRPAKKYRS